MMLRAQEVVEEARDGGSETSSEWDVPSLSPVLRMFQVALGLEVPHHRDASSEEHRTAIETCIQLTSLKEQVYL
jgi:hypothetical protein